ncbi:sensor histidine kinase [Autumnicola psychrophila]|uniref:Histidine kinase n=1 Tax=Autumnicola psychrophila TaxID=3075592 RepID=A0ABU3DPV0_9FLAO|nr:histidine kinase [Zunongwangia sp. F225]MDT0685716.1 histidine kinase [Zunongwangia sp. F225]
MKKLDLSSKEISYWVLQILVWTFLSSVMAVGYWAGGNELKLKPWQVITDFSVVILLSIFFTHQIKRTLNGFIQFDALNLKDIFKILGLLITGTLLFYLTYELYIKFAYSLIYHRLDVLNHPSQEMSSKIVFILNYCIYFIIWTVFYVAIKSLMELNKSRETRIQLESNLRESQLNTLKGQINPHFMFNSLNNIRGLMLEDVQRARDMLTSLSETLRYTLTKSHVDSIALEDELEMVRNFIEISKIQFEDRLRFKEHIDKTSLNTQIPPMIIQILIENAIKHGISNLKKGGTVNLSTELNERHLLIKVANTGNLRTSEDSTQLGLKNIKQRLELLYGEAATFSLKEIENQVVASIKIPVE